MSDKRKNAIALVIITIAYLLVAIRFTWPLAARIKTHGFGVDEDSPYHIWHNWWTKYAIFDLRQTPLTTNYIFHPQTIPLAFDANAFVFGAMTIPIQLVTNNVVLASNIIFLASFGLSGVAMYLLANHISRNRAASFIAGLIYAFAPYVFAQSIDGHTNLISIWIIPLYALSLIKLERAARDCGENCFSEMASNKKALARTALLAGFFITLQAYNDLTYTAFTIFFTAIFVIIKVAQAYKRMVGTTNTYHGISYWIRYLKKLTGGLCLSAIFSAVIFMPVLIPTVKVFLLGLKPDAPLWVQAVWSADLVSFFKPPDFLPIFPRNWMFTAKQGTVEATVFPGYLPLILLAASLIANLIVRNKSHSKYQKQATLLNETRPWIFITIAFAIFSLGPWLKYANQIPFINIFGHHLPIYLPFTLLHKIPLIGGTQEPTRMNPYVIMGLSVISALKISRIITNFRKNSSKKIRKWIPIPFYLSLVIFAIGERMPKDFPTTDLTAPNIYYQIAQDSEEVSVLTLPVGFNSGNIALGQSPTGSLQYYQTIHRKPSFRGTVARLPIWAFDYYRDLPLFKYLIDPSQKLDKQDLDPVLVKAVFQNQLHIKYIIIHRDKYYKVPLGKTEELLVTVLGAEKIWEEGNVTAYILSK